MSHIKNNTEKNLEKTKKFEPKHKKQQNLFQILKLSKNSQKRKLTKLIFCLTKIKILKTQKISKKKILEIPSKKGKFFKKWKLKILGQLTKCRTNRVTQKFLCTFKNKKI